MQVKDKNLMIESPKKQKLSEKMPMNTKEKETPNFGFFE